MPSGRVSGLVLFIAMYLVLKGIWLYTVSMSRQFIQIKKGALEFCVLAVIETGEKYGYEIVKLLTQKGLTIQEGTIYPLLARLKREGYVEAYWQERDQGVPRKYYAITAEGKAALEEFRVAWADFSQAVNSIIKEG